MEDVRIGDTPVGLGHPVYVIAEMAWTHEGDLSAADKVFRGARAAGANAIGVHLTHLQDYMVRDYRCLEGQTLSAKDDTGPAAIYTYLESINTTEDNWRRLFSLAKAIGLHTCVMCNDETSLTLARELDPELYAVPAACFVEQDFVRHIAEMQKPIMLRIGGATLSEIKTVVSWIRGEGNNQIVILHGFQLYPTNICDLNLHILPALSKTIGCHVGLADHIDGEIPEAAVLPLLSIPLGAVVIEKHITEDRTLKREDFEAALGLADFAAFVRMIRQAEVALGSGEFQSLSPSEQRYRKIVRKKVVAARTIASGQPIHREDLAFKRADFGGDPVLVDKLIGRVARVSIAQEEAVDFDVLE